jgi:hypothetical protein
MNSQLVILQKTYDLMLYAFPLLARFPKNQRFTLAQQIQNGMLDMAAHIVRANMSRGRGRWLALREVNACLEVLRLNVRLSMELGFLKRKQWEQLSFRLNEIGRLLGGWMKSGS